MLRGAPINAKPQNALKCTNHKNGEFPVHRGENESCNSLLPCESPRQLNREKRKQTQTLLTNRGENESIILPTTLCILPDNITRKNKNTYTPVQRGENESRI